MQICVDALLCGKATPFARGQYSAIDKRSVEGAVRVSFLGLVGDEQADVRVHGGPGKALHHYPADHYSAWAQRAPEHPLLRAPGAFGENISSFGMGEDDVCIGDRFRLGSALIEVSQGRQPCWKQGHRMEWTTLPTLMVRERRSGWYYRVIEEGIAQAGDMLTLLDRPLAEWSVRRVFGLLIAGDHKRDREALPALAAMELLDETWRMRAFELAQ
jgi:MOSC domain-containing protein YiiM